MYREPAQPTSLDRAAVARPLTEDDLRAFLSTQRVFISSVMSDLRAERQAVAEAVEGLGAIPVMFERFGGRDADPEDAYVAEVRTSTVYVGILGQRYGKRLPTRFSATHTEFNEAEEAGLRVSVWTISNEDWDGHQADFVADLRVFHTTGSFNTSTDLAVGVSNRLREIAAEEMSPWCKLGPLVFRASKIRVRSGQVEVTALVRDPGIADALEALRPDAWRKHELQFTDPNRSWSVRVEEIESVATSASGREITLHLEKQDSPGSMFMDTSYNSGGRTYLPDDLTELALREHLFGEPTPVESGFVSLPDPLQLLPPTLPDEIVRPILRLVFAEVLIGSGRAERITTMRLGPSISGRRRLVLEWSGPSLSGRPPQLRRIEGLIAIP